jgi:hypothetical protein
VVHVRTQEIVRMLARLFRGPKARRRVVAVRPTREQNPLVEEVESRALLTALVMIDNPSVVEGTGGTNAMHFNVRLSGASSTPVTVAYHTVDRTALAGSDYTPVSGVLSFAPGQTSATVSVPIVTDSNPEPLESFALQLSNATNAFIYQSQGIGSIVDDDTAVAPKLSINDVSIVRGLNGSKTMLFTVSLNGAQTDAISVTAKTLNGTAVAGKDYLAKSEVLTFNPGELVKTFAVTVYGTSTVTSDKIFGVTLSGTSATLARATGAGTLRYGA